MLVPGTAVGAKGEAMRLRPVETPLLYVREIVVQDARDFARYMTRPDYQRHIAARLDDRKAVQGFVMRALAHQQARDRRAWFLAAILKGEGAATADGFILKHRSGLYEIGWGVDPDYWGRGIASQLAAALAAIAIERLGAGEVGCKVMAPNRASVRVALKAGFRQERSVPAGQQGSEAKVDVDYFLLTRHDYFEAPY
jgi:ribosomal-protein-alanine N-acetyltransferase